MESNQLVYSLVAAFARPSVWGWYAEEALCLTPVSTIRRFQKRNINNLSLSDIISKGSPFSQYHLSKNNTASCSAFVFVEHGTSWMSEFKRSVMVRIQSIPFSSGSGPIKSIAMLLSPPFCLEQAVDVVDRSALW